MIFNIIEQILLSALLLAAISSFTFELFKRYKIVMKGTGSFSFDNLPKRLYRVLAEFVLQKKVLSQRFWPGLMHALVFWGLSLIHI